MLLDRIQKPNDIKKIPREELPRLAGEIREFLIEKVSRTGGHLGSNLGVVELTMALHRQLNLPKDKIVFDVGHQSYIHKLLTGRKEGFDTLRQYGGMSGFPKRGESDCDAFDTGHSSTSISVGLGLVKARDLKKENYTVVTVIGDGALTGGLAYEGLNNAAKLRTNYIIILNDNAMSISENVGGMSKYLQSIRTAVGYQNFKSGLEVFLKKSMPRRGEKVVDTLKRVKSSMKQLIVPGMLFEDMGITYLGPVDGHDITAMEKAIKEAKNIKHTVIIHVCTKKGKGYAPAERHPARFHGTGPFEIETGLPKENTGKASYTDVFSTVMIKLAARNDEVVAITAAMPDGTGLKRFRNIYPDRFVDVGIAEGHAVTFAGGLAAGGMKPIVAIYSSFLQRAYDEMLHDVCIGNLHVVFAIDRAGLVGADGETHQGIFDLSYLSSMPNMTVMAPKNKWELSDMQEEDILETAPLRETEHRRHDAAHVNADDHEKQPVNGSSSEDHTAYALSRQGIRQGGEAAVLLAHRPYGHAHAIEHHLLDDQHQDGRYQENAVGEGPVVGIDILVQDGVYGSIGLLVREPVQGQTLDLDPVDFMQHHKLGAHEEVLVVEEAAHVGVN
ncbi:MAG: 1-deoxy-D-xylulose-5-phosphate synthase, partial [Lachnospiraceae bacterium]|nr:1-deoxy-D-xylulose-5-phosphate synthase [Lachnospiraceae bacterium]